MVIALDPFKGQAAHQAEWDAFCARYTQNGKTKSNILRANLLNELANTDTTPEGFIEKHKHIPYTRLKEHIDEIMLAQGREDEGADSPSRGLNEALMTGLLHKWMAVLTKQALYPPPKTAGEEGKTRGSVSNAVKMQRDNVRAGQNSGGGLLASVIASGSLPTIQGAMKAVRGKVTGYRAVDLSNLETEAVQVYDNTLFGFDDSKGNLERNTGARFKSHLYTRILSIAKSNIIRAIPTDASLDANIYSDDARELHDIVADTKAVDADAAMQRQDEIEKVLRIAKEVLTPQQMQVFCMRHGLNEQQKVYTAEETAAVLGIAVGTVRGVEQRAMRNIREEVLQQEKENELGEMPAPELQGQGPSNLLIERRGIRPKEQPKRPSYAELPPRLQKVAIPHYPKVTAEVAEQLPDYPYKSLKPFTGLETERELREIRLIEGKHISRMLEQGLPAACTANPRFYHDVMGQWEALLHTRKAVRGVSVVDTTTGQQAAIKLMQELLARAPDAGFAKATLSGSSTPYVMPEEPTYQDVLRKYGGIDFYHPRGITKALMYDPAYHQEAEQYLAQVPADVLAGQLRHLVKPRKFDTHATMGESLEAYVFSGGKTTKEFFELYCRAKGYQKKHSREDRITFDTEALAKEMNTGLATPVFDGETIARWMSPTSAVGLGPKHREGMVTRYGFSDKQKQCLNRLCGLISSMDTPEGIINREEERLKGEEALGSRAKAGQVFKALIGVHPELTAEGLSKRIGGVIGPQAFQRWIKEGRLNKETLLPHVHEVAKALVAKTPPPVEPQDIASEAALVRRAEDLLLGMPGKAMDFSETVGFARKHGYSIPEFVDLRRCQMRDEVAALWKKKHPGKALKPIPGFQEFLLEGKPPELKISGITVRILRNESGSEMPKREVLNYMAQKLGAKNAADITAFRKMVYEHPLEAGQGEVDVALVALEACGGHIESRTKAYKDLMARVVERDGLHFRTEIAPVIVAGAIASGKALPPDVTQASIAKCIEHMTGDGQTTSEEKARLLAAHFFPDSADKQARLCRALTELRITTYTPEMLDAKVAGAFDVFQVEKTREQFEAVLKAVELRDRLNSRRELAAAVADYAEQARIVPTEGKITAEQMYHVMRHSFKATNETNTPQRIKALAAYVFPRDEGRSEAFEGMFTTQKGSRRVKAPPAAFEVRVQRVGGDNQVS